MTVEVSCQQCDGTGFVPVEDGQGSHVVPCGCARVQVGDQDLVRAGVPRRYLHCSLDGYKPVNALQRTALAVSRAFCDDHPAVEGGILFTGNCGAGKTHLAAAILRRLMLEQGVAGCFADYQDLLKRLQASYSRQSGEGPTEDDILSPVLEAELLILDDLGSRRSTPWAEETLGHVLTVRYNEQRLTILTTNLLDLDEEAGSLDHLPGGNVLLSERVSERVLSRIHEMCRIVNVEGPDHRRGRRG